MLYQTRNLKIMDFGRYLIGQHINLKMGQRMIYNPELIGKNLLGLVACSTNDINARRIASKLRAEI